MPGRKQQAAPRVGLFVTCLVDLFRPAIGFAALKLLEEAGCTVEVPVAQTCCGRSAYSSGDRQEARAMAQNTIEAFKGFDHVVTPSGACAGMLAIHYPVLFEGDPEWQARATALAAKVHELTSFLVDIQGMGAVGTRLAASVTYHDACAGLNDLGVRAQPRMLLESVEGIRLVEMRDPTSCCGFGGCAGSHPALSASRATRKTADIEAAGADMLLAGDLGCLMDMAGRLRRQGSQVEVRHIAEVLAGMVDGPPIGARHANRQQQHS